MGEKGVDVGGTQKGLPSFYVIAEDLKNGRAVY